MKYLLWIFAAVIIVGGALLAANGAEPPTVDEIEPAHIEPIDGVSYHKITITARAAERLDLQTAAVGEQQFDGQQYTVLPYSALIYDLNGGTWVYVSPAPLTYHREPITVDFISGDLLYLIDGPPKGTEVATVGVAELYGIDTGVGK